MADSWSYNSISDSSNLDAVVSNWLKSYKPDALVLDLSSIEKDVDDNLIRSFSLGSNKTPLIPKFQYVDSEESLYKARGDIKQGFSQPGGGGLRPALFYSNCRAAFYYAVLTSEDDSKGTKVEKLIHPGILV